MSKYNGKYPHKIKSVEIVTMGLVKIMSNNGSVEWVHAEAIYHAAGHYLMPQTGEDIRIYSGLESKWGSRNVIK